MGMIAIDHPGRVRKTCEAMRRDGIDRLLCSTPLPLTVLPV